MISTLLAFATTGLSVGVFYGAFCRLDRMEPDTAASIRGCFSALGAAAAALAFAPWVPEWGYQPHPLVVLFVGTLLWSLVAMRKTWLFGVPGAVGR